MLSLDETKLKYEAVLSGLFGYAKVVNQNGQEVNQVNAEMFVKADAMTDEDVRNILVVFKAKKLSTLTEALVKVNQQKADIQKYTDDLKAVAVGEVNP